MGFRTVVVLSNDKAHEWQNDPQLGNKIFHCATMKTFGAGEREPYFPYGEIVEQVHADTQTVAFLDGYGGTAMVTRSWYHGQTNDEKNENLLKALAAQLGYKVSKIKTPA